jgi:hypothetical protein
MNNNLKIFNAVQGLVELQGLIKPDSNRLRDAYYPAFSLNADLGLQFGE